MLLRPGHMPDPAGCPSDVQAGVLGTQARPDCSSKGCPIHLLGEHLLDCLCPALKTVTPQAQTDTAPASSTAQHAVYSLPLAQ